MKAFFQEIVLAISNFKFYKHVKDFQTSRGVKYILSLTFLITLALTMRYSYDIGKGLNIITDWAKSNLPVIEIQNGVVSADVAQPYKIEEEGFVLIIDTTGEINSLDDYERGMLLTENEVIYKESNVKTETYDLANIESLRIDENFMKILKKNIGWILFPIMLILMFLYFCIFRFIQIFIFSVISLATCSIANVKLNYKQLFNIGIYAITPSVILGGLMALFAIMLPFFWILYAGLYIVFLIMGILNCKEAPAKGDVSP